MHYGNTVNANIVRTEQAGKLMVERGDIGIHLAAELPSEKGLSLHGKFNNLNADEWIALLNKPAKSKINATIDTNSVAINKADLNVDKLEIFGRSLNSLHLIARPNPEGIAMEINSREIVGNATWEKADNGKIIARLKNLTIPNEENGLLRISN